MIPAMRNESQTADPATAPAAPSRAKIPAPTIDPTPMKVACITVMRLVASVVAMAASCSPGSAPEITLIGLFPTTVNRRVHP